MIRNWRNFERLSLVASANFWLKARRHPVSLQSWASDALTLITLHSGKGLEFPRVDIVGLEKRLLPNARSAAEGTLDEERRLFYVAVTGYKLLA
jgi:superfamily I DNA/RNA helicase